MYASSWYRKLELKRLTRDRQSNQSKWHLELQQVQSAPIFPRFWWYGGAKLLNMQRLLNLWPSRLNPSWTESWKINPRKVRNDSRSYNLKTLQQPNKDVDKLDPSFKMKTRENLFKEFWKFMQTGKHIYMFSHRHILCIVKLQKLKEWTAITV